MSLFGGKEKQEIERLNAYIQQLQQQLSPEQSQAITLQQQIADLSKHAQELYTYNQNMNSEIAKLQQEVQAKKQQLIQLDDEILFQEFSLYRPIYSFANSEIYKERLESVRQQQKDLIKNKTAVSFSNNWTVDGSLAKGRKMNNDNIKQILRTFNTECENAIDRVKFSNIESMKKRIITSYETLNKLNQTTQIALRQEYLNLKLEELGLAIEFAVKKQEEKEEQQRIREELREQQKLQKEIEEARKALAKEQAHYKNALDAINAQIAVASEAQKAELEAKKNDICQKLGELDNNIKQVDYREANQKAGYVYIISNLGAFGAGVYKIGMTRRLEPMERINELGDASVPFVFDVHALIFSENAPGLEAALHKAFAARTVNCMNQRKEFFRCSIDEIKKVVRENYDKTVEFTELPEAEHYRQSLKVWEDRERQ